MKSAEPNEVTWQVAVRFVWEPKKVRVGVTDADMGVTSSPGSGPDSQQTVSKRLLRGL